MEMETQIKENDSRFTFDFKIDEEGWFAQCREYRGIMIGGRKKNPSEKEIMQALINAIKVAFHVPIDKLEIGKEELASQNISGSTVIFINLNK